MTSQNSRRRQAASPVLKDLGETEPGQTRWIWTNRIPRDHISLLTGDPVQGLSLN